jgi:hypothetical protein
VSTCDRCHERPETDKCRVCGAALCKWCCLPWTGGVACVVGGDRCKGEGAE